MKRASIAIWFLCPVILFISGCNTAGTQGIKPVSVEDSRDTSFLVGTTWAGRGFKDRLTTFQFKQGGILHYMTPEATYTNGTWKQFGNAVFAETNKHYTNLLGVVSGETMKGIAWNQHGDEWEWEFSKQDN